MTLHAVESMIALAAWKGIDFAFGLLLVGMVWLNAKASAIVKRWSVVLIVTWGLTGPTSYFGFPGYERFCILSDIILGVAAGTNFFAFKDGNKKRPLWLVWLILTYFMQMISHADDGWTKWVEINVLCAIQIALVSSDQACQRIGVCIKPFLQPLCRSHGALTRVVRAFDRRWYGLDMRPDLLRSSRKRSAR